MAWLFALTMALGVPVALRVPSWARRHSQSNLTVALAAPTGVAVIGLLLAPTLAPRSGQLDGELAWPRLDWAWR